MLHGEREPSAFCAIIKLFLCHGYRALVLGGILGLPRYHHLDLCRKGCLCGVMFYGSSGPDWADISVPRHPLRPLVVPQPACPLCSNDVIICHAVFHWEHYWLKSSSWERLLVLTPFILGCACCVPCRFRKINVAHINHKSVRFMCVQQLMMFGYPQVNQCSVCEV